LMSLLSQQWKKERVESEAVNLDLLNFKTESLEVKWCVADPHTRNTHISIATKTVQTLDPEYHPSTVNIFIAVNRLQWYIVPLEGSFYADSWKGGGGQYPYPTWVW
jgi:hypothetical protein